MLAKPTVIVLGAGASLDFGLPLGSKLAEKIRESLSFEWDIELNRGNRTILEAYRATGGNVEAFLESALKIAAALPSFKSIDDCLHTHSHNELGVLAGKMCIAQAVAQAEGESFIKGLWGDRRQRLAALEAASRTWAGSLVRTLVTGLPRADYAEVFQDLTVVSFNYDRCIESLLFHLIQPALDIDENEAANALMNLKVYHPYGSLGPLSLTGAPPEIPFGPSSLDLVKAAHQLLVYTEQRDLPPELLQMQDVVHEAGRMIFLGFGFHLQNVKILSNEAAGLRAKEMFGTVLGEPSPAVSEYQSRLGKHLGVTGPLNLVGVDCGGLLNHFGALVGG